MRYNGDGFYDNRRNKILTIVGAVILSLMIISAGFVLWSGKTADELYERVRNEAPPDTAQWIQTADTTYDSDTRSYVKKEDYFFTCENNGRKEGEVYEQADGLWHADSENSSEHWDRVRADFHTKEQAQQAVEKFVGKFEMCSEEHK